MSIIDIKLNDIKFGLNLSLEREVNLLSDVNHVSSILNHTCVGQKMTSNAQTLCMRGQNFIKNWAFHKLYV